MADGAGSSSDRSIRSFEHITFFSMSSGNPIAMDLPRTHCPRPFGTGSATPGFILIVLIAQYVKSEWDSRIEYNWDWLFLLYAA